MKRAGILFLGFVLFCVPHIAFASPLPGSVNLNVPFTVQAPFAKWDHTHEEACEEAAILMVHKFYAQQTFRSRQDAENGLQDLVAFQKKKYGFFEDTTAQQTAQLLKDRWGYKKVDVLPNPTLAQIKTELARGNPVIVPTAGRMLGNPYYTAPGPVYHMLVIKGYTADGWLITNDAGTRRGADYRYRSTVLLNAIHDWNGGKVTQGKKFAIVVRQ